MIRRLHSPVYALGAISLFLLTFMGAAWLSACIIADAYLALP